MTSTPPKKKLDDRLFEKRVGVSGITPIALTPKQKAQWDMTRSALLWNCPAFTHILYTMMARSNGDVALFTDTTPTAATDGATMLINPDWFFKLNLQQRIFVCAHEICHAIFDHCGQSYVFRARGGIVTPAGKKLDYDDMLMNIAQDLIINDMLNESKVGTLIQGICHDTSRAVHTDSMIDVYEKLHDEAKKNGGKSGVTGISFDTHMDPGQADGKDPTQAQQGRSPIEWSNAIAAAASAAKAQGKLPAAMERFMTDMLEPQVSWQEKIQAFFARKVGSGSYDWRRPDRQLITRDIYAPGRSGFGAGHVVVAVDTSGSIGDAELAQFFAEMRGILEDVRPKKISLVFCDAQVHKVYEIFEAEDLCGAKPHGGGGTDFRPVFEWIETNAEDADCLVFLTDGYGAFPNSEPKYPTLWGAIVDGVNYPFGEVVKVPVKH